MIIACLYQRVDSFRFSFPVKENSLPLVAKVSVKNWLSRLLTKCFCVMTTDEELQHYLVSLTRDLVMIPTTESRPDERKRCFEFLRNHIDCLSGVQVDFLECNDHQSMLVRPAGIEAPEILLCGHIDVIEHPQPDCYHSTVEQGRIVGPGTGDMKGQNAILVKLLCAFHTKYPGISLGLALTSDEERGGADGVRFLCEEKALRCGTAIIPDGGSLNEITIEEKGVIHVRVTCAGREAHGARPWLGSNALELLMERLTMLNRHFASYWPDKPIEEQVNHWFPTCSLTMCETVNKQPNRIPATASAVIDIRFPPTHSVDEMLNEIRSVLGVECHLELLMTAEPTHLDPDQRFCEITEQITGSPVRHVRASGGSDSRFFRQYDIPVNLSRPLVGNLHAIDEWIDIESMLTYYKICETYIEEKLQI